MTSRLPNSYLLTIYEHLNSHLMLSLNLHPANSVNQHWKRVHGLRKQCHTIIQGLTKRRQPLY
jgi:hypothetical protein